MNNQIGTASPAKDMPSLVTSHNEQLGAITHRIRGYTDELHHYIDQITGARPNRESSDRPSALRATPLSTADFTNELVQAVDDYEAAISRFRAPY